METRKKGLIMNIASFLIYCVIVTFTPGPTNIVILSTVQNCGTKKAVEFAYGASTGFALLLVISAVLNTTLMPVLPFVVDIMKIIGSLYILHLAYKIYKIDVSESHETESGGFVSGLLMQFVNPKVILFTITVIPSFVLPYYSELSSIGIFTFLIAVIGTSALITWILFGVVLKSFLQEYQKAINIIMALFLIYSAVTVSGLLPING